MDIFRTKMYMKCRMFPYTTKSNLQMDQKSSIFFQQQHLYQELKRHYITQNSWFDPEDKMTAAGERKISESRKKKNL